VNGFHGAVYKKLTTETEARAFIAGESSHKPPSSGPSSKVSSTIISPLRLASTSVSSKSSNPVESRPLAAVVSVEEDELGCDVVYSDGACKGNGKVGSVAGVGVWWGWNDTRREI